MLRSRLPAVLVICAFVTPAYSSPKIGDKAPVVKAEKWLTEVPPALPGASGADKHVFLVEFWATWCGPCMKSIPHLSELQAKHKKDGLVVIGMSNEEPGVIEKWIAKNKQAKKLEMAYHVAADAENATSEAWTNDIQTIPHAFIVDKKGLVVWTGNPAGQTDEMDRVIRKVIEGKFDVEAAKSEAAASKKLSDLMRQLQGAYQQRDDKSVFKILDEMIALKPKEVKTYLIKRHMLGEFEKTGAIADLDRQVEAAARETQEGSLDLAEFFLERDLKDRNIGLMIRSAQRADELGGGKSADSASILARIQWEVGLPDAAIVTQKRAVSLALGAEREELEKILRYYEEARAEGAKMKSGLAATSG